MLEVGKTYAYEYMHQADNRVREMFTFTVTGKEPGVFSIWAGGPSEHHIADDCPIALMAEEVEHVN